jgi:beta-lactamase superfamily II metal-dependent hydrolase
MMAYPLPYIAIVDVGHGSSIVLRDQNKTFIVDCGAKSAGLLEFLDREGVTEIDQIFLTHSDADHIGGLVGIVSEERFKINRIQLNPDGTKKSAAWDDLAYVVNKLHLAGDTKIVPTLMQENEWRRCGDIELEIVGPSVYLVTKGVGNKDSTGRVIVSNSLSASFRVHWKGQPLVYIAGDIDQVAIDDLRANGANLTADILVYPHHGGKSGVGDPRKFTESLCGRVMPKTVIFSIGRTKFENPRPEVVAEVKAHIKDVRISCTQLSVNCSEKIKYSDFSHLADVYSRGKEDNFCCSGSFVIRLHEGFAEVPERAKHLEFINRAAGSPLCL